MDQSAVDDSALPIAGGHPPGNVLGVVGLVLLGYAYLAGLLLLLVAVLAWFVVSMVLAKSLLLVKLALPVGGFAWMVVRSLWVQVPPPPGLRIGQRDAPALMDMIRSLRRAMRAPRFHRVLITDDFNAAVVQVPRLGALGWHRNYLLIGLPLLRALTPEQFKAVLAHEFGHLARGHGRMANWLYRLRQSWQRLVGEIERQSHWGSFLVKPFFGWYVGRFTKATFPMARRNEYQADASAAAQTSPATLAEALTTVELVAGLLPEQCWPAVYGRAATQAEPVDGVYDLLAAETRQALSAGAIEAGVQRAMARRTDDMDTHPSLSDRLAAIGMAPRVVLPAEGAGADRLLEPALADLVAALDGRWRESVAGEWRELHASLQADQARLVELRGLVEDDRCSEEERVERAFLEERVGLGPDVALDLLRELADARTDDPELAFSVGRRLALRGDGQAVAYLERAIALDEEAIAPGAQILRDFHLQRGETGPAARWSEILEERIAVQEEAYHERSTLSLRDPLEPHGLDEPALQALRESLRPVEDLRKLWLARKPVKHHPERPHYVLGFTIAPHIFFNRECDFVHVRDQILRLAVLPGDLFVCSVQGVNGRFRRRLSSLPGSRVL